MKQAIKSSLIIDAIIIGGVLSQTATPNTQNPPPQQNGTVQNQTQGQGQQGQQRPPRPQGTGSMGNGARPDGPNNLPPQIPGITAKLGNITDDTLTKLRNILQYLPPIEQDLIAGNFLIFWIFF